MQEHRNKHTLTTSLMHSTHFLNFFFFLFRDALQKGMEGSTFIFLLVKHYVSFNRWVFISVNDLLKEIQELPRQRKPLPE